jgi:RimJ/RimL family protein N-acetyltransferase
MSGSTTERRIAGARLCHETRRLRLTALTAAALEAWMEGDADRLRDETGVSFDEPVEVPPLFEEDLPTFTQRMRENASELGWWVWLVSTLADDKPVGVCGLGGRPRTGCAVLGYSVFPHLEGRGFATEASSALIDWVFQQDGVDVVRATVPRWNHASVAVARKLGMAETGEGRDRDVGEVLIYERHRRPSSSSNATIA